MSCLTLQTNNDLKKKYASCRLFCCSSGNRKWDEDSFRVWKDYTTKMGLLWRNGMDIADILSQRIASITNSIRPKWQKSFKCH
jgi:hypothetical protein